MSSAQPIADVTAAARQDLLELDDWTTANIGLDAAMADAEALRASFQRLASLPLSAPVRPDLWPGSEEVRCLLFHRRLLIFYLPTPKGVRVLRVFDARRNSEDLKLD